MPDDDELFRNDLRRAVATADVDEAWGSIARRVRVQRAGRATARIGIPAVCAVALVGGLVLATNRRGGDSRLGDTSTTVVDGTTTVATTASTTAPTTASTSTSPSSSAGVRATDTSTWPWQATSTPFGSFELAAVDGGAAANCVAVRPAGTTAAWSDACATGPFSAVRVIDDRLVVVGARMDDAPVLVEHSGGTDEVTPVTVPALGDAHVFGFALPVGAELTRVGVEALPTTCSYRTVLPAIDAANGSTGTAARIDRCVGGVAYASTYPSAEDLTKGKGLELVLVGPGTDGTTKVLQRGGPVCGPDVSSATDPALANACAVIGFVTQESATTTVPAAADWPVAGTATVLGTEVDVRAADVGGTVCVQARPTDGSDGGTDTCRGGDSFAVVAAGDRLAVVGTRETATSVTVATTQGDVAVPTFPFAGRRVYAAVLPAGVDVVAVGGSESAAECPYRELYAALGGTSWVGPGAGTGMSVERCRNGVAFVGLSSGHDILQGAGALFERVDGRFRAVNLGGDLCNRTIQPPTAQEELDACAKVGL